ncbi:MAG: nitroreductase family protein [bacterium]|jgi:nitroreductase
MDPILARRSIRRYTEEQVGEADIIYLLKAAMSAPSAHNEQPWHFVVINERRILDEVPKFHENAQMLKGAPMAILVCGDLTLEKAEGYWVQDCAAATENILIAAQNRGLGAVWLGIYPRQNRVEILQEMLNLPQHVIPFSLIPVGHPAVQKPPSERFDPARIHYNSWSK